MTVLVSASSVSAFYRELWVAVHGATAPDFLADGEPLPPFLCRSLAFGDPSFADDCAWVAAVTGSVDGVLHRFDAGNNGAGLNWGVSGISPLLYDYAPIDGYSLGGFSQYRNELFEEALALTGELGGSFLDTICDFTGMVLWLELDPQRTDADRITSSSFPGLPHCVVITDPAAMGVVPNDRFEDFSAWALAESLYHESLHQRLSATILQDEIFVDTFYAASGPTIHVDWRNADWPLDRSLHALFVYANLTKMREQLLNLDRFDGKDRDILARVHAQSTYAATQLGSGLENYRTIFTDSGNKLLTELRETL